MKIYEIKNKEDMADALLQMLEQETGERIFTLRIIEEFDDALETIVIFEDKRILLGKIGVQEINGKLAFRMKANFI